MQSELKPCPFCGGEAGKVFFLKGHTPASIGDTQHSETCPLALSWSGFYRPTPEEAIAAWNTRASDAEIERNRAEIASLTEALRAADERVEALREALEPFGSVGELIDTEYEGMDGSEECELLFDGYLMERFTIQDFRRAAIKEQPHD